MKTRINGVKYFSWLTVRETLCKAKLTKDTYNDIKISSSRFNVKYGTSNHHLKQNKNLNYYFWMQHVYAIIKTKVYLYYALLVLRERIVGCEAFKATSAAICHNLCQQILVVHISTMDKSLKKLSYCLK